jgi:hypothetical protein
VTDNRQKLRRCFFIVEAITAGLPPILFLVALFSERHVWRGMAVVYVVSFVVLPVISYWLRKTDRALSITGLVTFIILVILSVMFPFAMAPTLQF